MFLRRLGVCEQRCQQTLCSTRIFTNQSIADKGKQGWRIGSVEAIKNDFSAATTREARASIIRLYKLLRRFIRGEEASVELYDFV